MFKNKLCVFSLVLSSIAVNASAQTMNYRFFDYSGTVNNFKSANWRIPPGYFDYAAAPGLYLAFFGKADPAAQCSTSPTSGPLPVFNNIYWANVQADTGISSGGVGTGFSPYSNHPECSQKDRLGFTYAHFKNFSDSNSVKGLGLYSYTGPTPVNSSLSFFQTDDMNIQGNFASFINCNKNYPCSSPDVPRPFSGTSSDHNVLRVAVVSSQGVSRFSMEAPASQQIRQQIVFNFTSLDSVNNKSPSIQYLLSTAIAGIYADSAPAVGFDPAQDGIGFVGGRLGSAGQTQTMKDSANQSHAVWTSWAEPTQSNAWNGQKRFQAEISFAQLKNAMRLVVAKKKDIANPGQTHAASQVTNSELAAFFGPNYNQPLNWVVAMQVVAHEVSNPDWLTKRAVIGGNATELKVISLPY